MGGRPQSMHEGQSHSVGLVITGLLEIGSRQIAAVTSLGTVDIVPQLCAG